MGTYRVAFLLAGCPPIICAFIMCFIRRVKGEPRTDAAFDATNAPTADKKRSKAKISTVTLIDRNDVDKEIAPYLSVYSTSDTIPKAGYLNG